MRIGKQLLVGMAVVSQALAPMQTVAQAVEGFYVGGGVGMNQKDRMNFGSRYWVEGSSSSNTEDFNISSEIGWAALFSLGWGLGNGWRLEVEGNYRSNKVSDINYRFPGGAWERATAAKGTARSYGVMGNAFYDFVQIPYVTPYLGVGIGYIWNQLDQLGGVDQAPFSFDDVNGSLAFQGIIGLALPIEAVPGLSLTAEYRYIATQDTDHGGSWISGTGATLPQNAYGVNHGNHSALIGLRYAFNTAPAVAATAPVAAAKTFLIFFDWNKADLTDRARQIIGEAASSRGQGVTRIEVNGYTDRSGSDQYNQGLSVRRANAVAAELVRRGVPRNEIVTRGFGEANPLVPTADGVREPQNRRVEIILK